MNETELIDLINDTVTAVAGSLASKSVAIDANPSGIEAVVVAAVLRAYTRIVTIPFSQDAQTVTAKIEEEVYNRLVKEALTP